MGKKSQRRAAAREAEKLADRRKIEEQFGIKITPAKPLMGGRYLEVKQPSPIRYPPPKLPMKAGRHG